MLKKQRLFAIAVMVVISNFFAFGQKTSISADDILKKTHSKLISLKSIGYTVRIEYNYASESYLSEMIAENYIDFVPEDSAIGIRYQFSNPDTFDVYNGSERFVLKKKPKTILVQPKPDLDNLKSVTLLQFSPLMLRNSLPKVIADRSIARTITESTLDGRKVYVIELSMNKAYIDSGNGDITPMTIDRKTVYRIAIEKGTFMPVQIYRGNDQNKDFNRATYTGLLTRPKSPAEPSWYYSTFTAEYKPAAPVNDVLIKPGEQAHEINLPKFPSGEPTNFAALSGKVVLLDFWIFHCGYCQESVPKMNELYNKFKKEKNFEMLAVNAGDSPKLIQLFVKNLKPIFPIVQNGEETAKKYGVPGYPMAVLIGKDGKVIYSGKPDTTKLDSLIEENLRK